MDRLTVAASPPWNGGQRTDVAKKQIFASQTNPAAFRAVGARLATALTHHDAALRGEAGCVPDQPPATLPGMNAS
jgi:hypothetical protein